MKECKETNKMENEANSDLFLNKSTSKTIKL